jgi:tetratricopeptide (TPR) repeat protein/tRNA A-37 threonylcarbamoyl transferase component Bud32
MGAEDPAAREQRFNEVVAAYLEAVEVGQAGDRAQLIALNADLAAELAEFFTGQDDMARLVAPLRSLVGPDTPRADAETRADLAADTPEMPPQLGDYELLAEVGRGGMGVVYRARQKSLGRLVALKMIRAPELASADERRRFRNEAETAAGLDHPSIVPVYEVGEHGGQLFFSMKLVEGPSLAERPDRFRDDARDAARLVAEAARAVHHAHQRGVLHRDLKPGNILLDGDGRPHVTDFGLARRVEGDTTVTQSGMLVGTPGYMAPEQAAGKRGAVTTATDVHGLGGLLYALLTGRAPFGAETPLEALAQVTEREAEPPSRVNSLVGRDLETICLKCLQKEPQRRYGSAEAVADDLERWLHGEPIAARRTGAFRRGVKWVRRRPALAALLGVSVLAVLSLLAGGLWYNAKLKAALDESQRAKAKAEAISRFVIKDILEQATPGENQRSKQFTVEQALDRAVLKIDGAFPDEPEVEASIRRIVGSVYSNLGLYKKGEPQLRKALELLEAHLGPDHPDTLETATLLGALLWEDSRLSEAETIIRKCIAHYRRTLGPDHARTLAAVHLLAQVLHNQGRLAEGERLAREHLDATRRARGPEHLGTIDSMNMLGQFLREQGKLEEAGDLFQQCLQIGRRSYWPGHPRLLDFTDSLARLRRRQGRLCDAKQLFRENLKAARRTFGPEHRFTLMEQDALATVLTAEGKLEAAERLLRETIAAHRKTIKPEHRQALGAVNHLAEVLQAKGSFTEAEKVLRPNLAAAQRTLGDQHPVTLWAMFDLAAVLFAQGKGTEAESLARRCRDGRRKTLPGGHWETALAENLLGGCLTALHRYAEAEPLLRDSYRVLKASPSALPAQRREAVARVRLYETWQRSADAATWRTEAERLARLSK